MLNRTYFHVAAMRASIANGITNGPLSAVNDNILSVNSAGQFLVPEKLQLRAASVGGINLTRTRINTPSLRYIALPYLAPINTAVAIPSPPNVFDAGENGPMLPPADSIVLEATHSDAAPQVMYGVMFLRQGFKPQTPGVEYRIRLTATITGVVGSWASGSMTPDQTLPSGIYDINGLDAFGTNLLAARLIFPGGGYRPGCIARNAALSIAHPIWTSGALGCYGTFDSVNLPNLEVYVEAANSAQEVYMDVVRTGDR